MIYELPTKALQALHARIDIEYTYIIFFHSLTLNIVKEID